MNYGQVEPWVLEIDHYFTASAVEILHLSKPISVEGRDYWGRPAKLTFYPNNQPGWFWLYDKHEPSIQITAELLHSKLRRIALIYEKCKLECFEHIGVLRWLGLDGITIESSSWPPYHGRSIELWHALKPAFQPTGEYLSWFEPKKESCGFKEGDKSKYTRIKPDDDGLKVSIICQFPGIGMEEISFESPADRRLLEISLEARALGWPLWTYHISRLASLIWWPHHNCITWLQELGPDETLRLTTLHRLLDLLGPLSIAHPTGLIAANIESSMSGHSADVEAIKGLTF